MECGAPLSSPGARHAVPLRRNFTPPLCYSAPLAVTTLPRTEARLLRSDRFCASRLAHEFRAPSSAPPLLRVPSCSPARALPNAWTFGPGGSPRIHSGGGALQRSGKALRPKSRALALGRRIAGVSLRSAVGASQFSPARKAGASAWALHERALAGEFTPAASYQLHTTRW